MRVGHPVVAVWGGIVLLVCLGLAHPSYAEPPASTGILELYDAVPPDSPVRVRVGDGQQFSVWVAGDGLQYQWMVDGGVVAQRRSWLYAPQATDLGPHLVTVAVDGPDGRATWTWRVQVVTAESPISPPTTVAPTVVTTTEVPVTEPPATTPPPTIPPTTTTETTLRPTTTTSTRVPTTTRPSTSTSTSTTRAHTTSSTREPTTTSTRLPTTTSTRLPTTTSTREPTTTTVERATTTSTTAPPPTRGAISDGEVRALFERYKTAWRNSDVKGLEAVGQVATQGQADALKQYFESVRDLEVDVTIVSITPDGDGVRVKFVRRDKFRDPAGNLVNKESPVIEKRIVRTPGGLRLAPPR